MRTILRIITLFGVFIGGFIGGGIYFADKDTVFSKVSNSFSKEKKEETIKIAVKPKITPKVVVPEVKNKSIFTVQVASFKDQTQAEKYVAQLQAKNYDAFIAPRDSSNPKNLYRICIGESLNKEQASSNLAKLKPTFKDSFLQSF